LKKSQVVSGNRPDDSSSWRARWHTIIFDSHTPKGRLFDVLLLVAIVASLITIMLESVPMLLEEHRKLFRNAEWFFTILFTLEYIIRLIVVKRPMKYALSFYGIIDLISIIPTYLAIFIVGAQYFLVVRSFRLLRVFRVLKMVRFLGEARMLTDALRASRIKITVFLIAVVCIVFIMGTAMYIIEGGENGFTSIPSSIYWCIVTLTTVGYGDISPQTPWGKAFASIIMIIGYGIIAVPTGIVTAEMGKAYNMNKGKRSNLSCSECGEHDHDSEALYCKSCGHELM
jgi:voltage-gated potassium channel